jgi:hypothetical protein
MTEVTENVATESLGDQLLARMVRIENRVSVVLASLSADIVNLRVEIGTVKGDLPRSFVEATQKTHDVVTKSQATLVSELQGLRTQLLSLSRDSLAITETSNLANAELVAQIARLKSDIIEQSEKQLLAQATASESISALEAALFNKLHDHTAAILADVQRVQDSASGQTHQIIGDVTLKLNDVHQTLAMQSTAVAASEAALKSIVGQTQSDLDQKLDTLQLTLTAQNEAVAASEAALKTLVGQTQSEIDQKLDSVQLTLTAQSAAVAASEAALKSIVGQTQSDFYQKLDTLQLTLTAQTEAVAASEIALKSLVIQTQSDLDQKLEDVRQSLTIQSQSLAETNATSQQLLGQIQMALAAAASRDILSQADFSAGLEGLQSAHAANRDDINALAEKLTERLVDIDNRQREIETSIAHTQTDFVNLSMQVQATEQRTLSGLVQVQTDSANRTTALAEQNQALQALIETLEKDHQTQIVGSERKLSKVIEHKTDALHRLIVSIDNREKLHDMAVKLSDVALLTAQSETRLTAQQVTLEAKLETQKAEIIEAVKVLFAEERAHLFGIKLFKTKS